VACRDAPRAPHRRRRRRCSRTSRRVLGGLPAFAVVAKPEPAARPGSMRFAWSGSPSGAALSARAQRVDHQQRVVAHQPIMPAPSLMASGAAWSSACSRRASS
jgi:hypothetical protein